MRQKNDYDEMHKILQKLELKMHEGDSDYDSLNKRFREVGKPNTNITKTILWHWLVEKGDYPESYFYATPPIGEASESDRVLITGTKVETRDMYDIMRGLEVYQRVICELQNRRKKISSGENIQDLSSRLLSLSTGGNYPPAGYTEQSSEKLLIPARNVISPQTGSQSNIREPGQELIIASRTLEEFGVKPEYVFCGRVGSFWEVFFGESEFLDHPEKVSLPQAIIGTGYIRNYNRYGGETMNVKIRLEEIAREWDIPIQIISSWAP
jgi:hypothetical protein